jgi:hypothetical protein
MLVVFHFHRLGYSTLEIAFLFLFYEFFGIVTNLWGGWLGARFGLRLTLWAGLVLQIAALLMLVPVSASWPRLFSLLYVMGSQAISGIAKDLNKMSDERQERHPDRGAANNGRSQPRGTTPFPLGGAPHRLQERPQGGGLLPRWRAAHHPGLFRLCRRHGRGGCAWPCSAPWCCPARSAR